MIEFIALCGAPGSGKTQTQKALNHLFGCIEIDDKKPLRDGVMALYGLTEEDVSTQEGKARELVIHDRTLTVRQVMGELGAFLEARDPNHFPKQAIRLATLLYPGQLTSFGSVRMDQGRAFKETGKGLVVEIRRRGYISQNDFDHYNPHNVDVVIQNPYDPNNHDETVALFLKEVETKLTPWLK